jgi:hypothetical protein
MKIARIALLPLVSVMAISSGARAQEDSPIDRPGLDVGLRLGFASPFGKLAGDLGGGPTSISDYLSGTIPLALELGYRINADFTLGMLFQYAFGLTKNCGPGESCSASDIRLGLEGLYRIQNESQFIPWFGVGFGYEWLSLGVSSGGESVSVGFRGFEFVTLQAGGDYRLSPYFSLGPFVSFSLGQYDTASAEMGASSGSRDIPNKDMHEWLQFGMKGTFNL